MRLDLIEFHGADHWVVGQAGQVWPSSHASRYNFFQLLRPIWSWNFRSSEFTKAIPKCDSTRWPLSQRASGLLFLDVLNSSSMLCTSAARAMVTTHSSPTHVTRYIYQHCSVQYPPLPVTWTLGRKPVGDLAKAIDLKLKCHVIEVIPTLKRRKFNEKMGWVPIW